MQDTQQFKYWLATELELIDYVTKHLLSQGKKSMTEDGMCMYWHPEGLTCAAGCLLNDLYEYKMEGHSWRDIVEVHSLPTVHQQLIGALQAIHDGIPPSRWVNELANLRNHTISAMK
jgi:hypothetical protein